MYRCFSFHLNMDMTWRQKGTIFNHRTDVIIKFYDCRIRIFKFVITKSTAGKCASMTYISFWNFVQNTTVSLPCSVQNFKTIGQWRYNSWRNEMSFGGNTPTCHDDVIKWKHFPRYWPFVRGIHRSPVNSPHKGQWRGAFMFSLICARINRWVNNREAGDLRRYRTHYDVTVMHSNWKIRQSYLKARDSPFHSNYQLMIVMEIIDIVYRLILYSRHIINNWSFTSLWRHTVSCSVQH